MEIYIIYACETKRNSYLNLTSVVECCYIYKTCLNSTAFEIYCPPEGKHLPNVVTDLIIGCDYLYIHVDEFRLRIIYKCF